MTISINGTNGLIQAYDYQVLTTGFSYTFAAGTQVLVINPAGTLATGTITMPALPSDGMTITVESTQQVTALTMSGNGGTIVGAAIQLIPNQPLSWVYRTSNTTWYPFSGGAGRATALVSGTSQASTSGTSIDFTGLPSWVNRITIMFSGVSTSGTSAYRFQLRVGGAAVTSNYTTASFAVTTAVSQTTGAGVATDGWGFQVASASSTQHGQIILSKLSSNTWAGTGQSYDSLATERIAVIAGRAFSVGTVDGVRITTAGGTDTFDAGSINILYE